MNAIQGALLGTAVGDAMGLPCEGLPRKQAAKMLPLRHRLCFGCGMLSDDTEHSLLVLASLNQHRDDSTLFAKAFARRLRWWLLAMPAGVGLSTARAITKLWLGFPPTRSGVRSAGNGAAMRSAVLGAALLAHPAKRREFTLAACRVTHTDPRAEESAVLVAEAAVLAANHANTEEVLTTLEPLLTSTEMRSRFASLRQALAEQQSVHAYATIIGCEKGVSGFAPNTVAVALYAWLRHRNGFGEMLSEVIACGGDTDTVAAIAGGIAGAEVGEEGIPAEWIAGIRDWPRSTMHLREMAAAVSGSSAKTPEIPWLATVLRNLVFLLIVLAHGFRRLLPF